MSRHSDSPKVRKPAVAGSFYPSSAKEIQAMIGPWLHPAKGGAAQSGPTQGGAAQGGSVPQALIVPHAGYVFSGEVAGAAFSRIPKGHGYKRIFLIGPSHRVGFAGASVDTLYDFAGTPLGPVRIDVATGQELIRKGEGAFTCRNDAHDREHCLEVQLPFLQMVFEDVPPIVPIIVGTYRLGTLQKIAEVLEPYFNEENLFIISSDFSHYPSYENAKTSDLFLAEAITSGGLVEFLNALSDLDKKGFPGEYTAACGASAIAILLSIMDAQGRGGFAVEHVMYRNSGDSPYGDKDSVVGYNAIVVSREDGQEAGRAGDGAVAQEGPREDEHLFHFTDEEKARMIATARSAIYIKLGLIYEGDTTPIGILKEKGYGVFVTLNLDGRLRGCIGRFTSSSSLQSTIREMALSAAFDDPRFPALSRKEAPKVEIEVSVLSPLKRIESIAEFKLGRDGIYMIKGYNHGTFLPQVATETGWSTEEFLGHCARDKAGIGWFGWKDAELYTYQAEVVKESDLDGAGK